MYLNAAASGMIRFLMPLTWAFLAAPLLIWRALSLRPDVVVVVQPTILIAPTALCGAFLAGGKTVQHVQDIEIDAAFAVGHLRPRGVLARFAFWAERLIMRRFDQVVTISNRMRDRLIEKGLDANRITVVRNWVDTQSIYPLGRVSEYRAELGIANDVFVVQYSGQMGRKQALHLIIEAARSLADDRRFHFVLAGDGPVRGEMERAAATLPNIRLLPLQPSERLNEFLNLADCHILTQDAGVNDLVLPSKLGGMLASGKRLLITAEKGSELIDFLGDAATFVPPENARSIVEALKDMIRDVDTTGSLRAAKATELDARTLLPRFDGILTGEKLVEA